MWNSINQILANIDNFVWGVPLMVIILFGGILLTVRLGLLQLRKLPLALKWMVKNEEEAEGEITSFAALCTALSATIGTGNIVGVATAVCAGGPGALFWMVITAFFGMATKYSEGLLAVKYRVIGEDGHSLGGPFYYIEQGMGKNWKWLAKLFAFFGVCVGLFGIGTFSQVNGISSAVNGFFDANNEHCVNIPFLGEYSWSVVIASLILAVCVALVLIGGVKRIASVSQVIGEDGHSLGGPFYYIEQGMGKNWKWLAKLFAFFGVCVGLFGIGTFSQVNGISSAVNGFFDANNEHCVNIPFLGEYSWSVVIASLILAVCVALVLIGGVKRIASVSQVVVPFMAIIYVLFVAVLVIANITKVPAAFKIIVQAAFSPRAITGGAVGSMLVAMQKGVARGIFSNEAGLGSAPIAAAAAQTNEPVRQGLVSMTGTFIDTIVICTLTGLSIVITGAWQVEGLEGVAVTTYAFQNGLPFPAQVSSFVLMLCLVFFAFTTILGWDYYSERCLEYLSGGNMKHVKIYRWIYILAVFIGPYMTVSAVWTIADIFNGLMALPNMIALFALSGVVVKETKSFFERHNNEKL